MLIESVRAQFEYEIVPLHCGGWQSISSIWIYDDILLNTTSYLPGSMDINSNKMQIVYRE